MTSCFADVCPHLCRSAAIVWPDLWLFDYILVVRYTLLKYFYLFLFFFFFPRKRNLSGLYHLKRSIKFRNASKGEERSTEKSRDLTHFIIMTRLLGGNSGELFNYFCWLMNVVLRLLFRNNSLKVKTKI